MDAPPLVVPDDDAWRHVRLRGDPITVTLTYMPRPPLPDLTFWLPAWMRLLDVGTAVLLVVGTQTFAGTISARHPEQDGTRYVLMLDKTGVSGRETSCHTTAICDRHQRGHKMPIAHRADTCALCSLFGEGSHPWVP